MTRSTHAFDEHSITDDVLAGVDVAGRHVVITGATSGIGRETARALARAGAHVTITARSAESAAKARAKLASLDVHDVATIEMELTDLTSVRRCADQLTHSHPQLDIAILNAGVMAVPLARTREGWELHLAANHIGHFALARELLALLGRAPAARVVVLSSAAHSLAAIDPADPHFVGRPYDPWVAYAQSKTANALFALEFDRRHGETAAAFSVHPGMAATRIGRHLTAADLERVMNTAELSNEPLRRVEQAAASVVWAAAHPAAVHLRGNYIANCSRGEVAAHACDPRAARQLWDYTESLLDH